MQTVIIIGAGLAGLSAAVALAEQNIPCSLVSLYASERAQSVLAEGGINAALNTMGEDDTPEQHYADTLRAGVYLADPNAVKRLTAGAPDIVRKLQRLGAAFNLKPKESELIQRNFGGQKKKRTAYARSSTGKILMTTMIDVVRRWEREGLVTRYPHHEFLELCVTDQTCCGAAIRDTYTGEIIVLTGPVILCTGGLNGLFPEMTTGTTANRGDVAAKVFSQGVCLGNLEMIQYHPTTVGISGKRCLITEAARGEGARLYTERGGKRWYFMEEKYPEQGNLMPRDVVSREMYFVMHDPECSGQVWLDMTVLSNEVWQNRLPELREELIHYLGIDPKKKPIPVEPGIHYFMGGIHVDEYHRTNLKNLYAAGECCDQYHGANRLGGNSLLGALFGGKTAAEHLAEHIPAELPKAVLPQEKTDYAAAGPKLVRTVRDLLLSGMGIVRTGAQITEALEQIAALGESELRNQRELERIKLAEAILCSALARQESRGAHYRSDYPETDSEMANILIASLNDGEIEIAYTAVSE